MQKQAYIKLPLRTPLINCITQDAYLQAIVLCNDTFYPWMMSNFVQLWACDPKIAAGGVFIYFVAPSYWFACPHLYTQELSKETINIAYDHIADFLTDSLSRNQYVVIPVNRRFIKAFHFEGEGTHDLLVYGYDLTQGIFYIADFFDGKFSTSTCDFQEMEDAYFTDTLNPFSWHNAVRLAVQDNHSQHYDFHLAAFHGFDTNVVGQLLEDYIQGKNSIYRYRICQKNHDSYSHTVGGTQVYDVLAQYSREKLDAGEPLDHRVFYNLWAHKHMHTLRTKYMDEHCEDVPASSFVPQFEQIEERARCILNLVLKYRLKGSGLASTQLVSALDDLKTREVETIREFLTVLP